MRVISWDIGTRNLSYNILERYLQLDDDGNEIPVMKIIQWGLIDLLDKFERKCACGRIARWIVSGSSVPDGVPVINDGTTAWCGQHVGGHGVVPLALKSKSGTCIDCKSNAKWVTQGRSKERTCVKHLRHPKIKRYRPIVTKKFPINMVKDVLIRELEMHPEFLMVHHVGIENQPSLTNPRAKSLSETLYHWFLIRGHVDRHLTFSPIRTIEFIAPNAKIPDRQITREARKAKIMGICEEFIRGTKWEQFYNNFSKRDDLADTLVQAFVIFNRIKEPEWQLDPVRMSQVVDRATTDAQRMRQRNHDDC